MYGKLTIKRVSLVDYRTASTKQHSFH